MVPGDSWNDQTGFTLQEQDFFASREKYLADYAAEVAPILEKTYRQEAAVRFRFSAFAAYFRDFMHSLPRLARVIFKPVIAFKLANRPGPYWMLISIRKRSTRHWSFPPISPSASKCTKPC